MVRLFIGVKLPNGICEKLASFQTKLTSVVEGSFVPKENMHITLRFLGDVKKALLEQIKTTCASAIKSYKFSCEVKGAGVFPSAGSARVVWAGVGSGTESLAGIWKALDEKLSKYDFEGETDFHPHVTLVRVKKVLNKEVLRRVLRGASLFGAFRIEEVCLMKSELTKSGAKYSVIEKIVLQ